MWILRYLILATRQRCNTLLDRRTRMNFDPLHGCPMHVCADKAEWDRRGKDQVAQLESELRQDIEAYHTETGERRAIKDETIEVRPVVLDMPAGAYGQSVTFRVPTPEPLQAFKEFLGAAGADQSQLQTGAPSTEPEGGSQNTLKREQRTEAMILPEAAPEMEAAPVLTGDALVSSGVEAQAEAEPGADPTFLEEAGAGTGTGDGSGQDLQDSGISGLGTESEPAKAGTTLPSTEVPEPVPVTEAAIPKAKTKPAGKAGKK